MVKIKSIQRETVEEIVDLSSRNALPYSEYNFLPTEMLRKSLKNVLLMTISKEGTIAKALYFHNRLAGYFIIEKAAFDSEIFEINAYRISFLDIFEQDPFTYRNTLQKVVREIKQTESSLKIKYLVYSINTNNSDSALQLSCLIENQFYLINTLLSFSLSDKNIRLENTGKNTDILIRKAKLDDVEEIVAIAGNSHRLNRFYLDPNLDKQKCDVLHATSARNSIIQGFADIVFVAEYQGKIIGYYSGKKKQLNDLNLVFGEALISAVNKDYRGKGVFSLLDNALLTWFMNETDYSEMGTYINNPAIYKTWIKKGLHLIRGNYQIAKFNSSF